MDETKVFEDEGQHNRPRLLDEWYLAYQQARLSRRILNTASKILFALQWVIDFVTFSIGLSRGRWGPVRSVRRLDLKFDTNLSTAAF